MMIYNQGVKPSGPFGLYGYPNASCELRRLLDGSVFPALASEWSH
jgi:hypothetical protein